MEPFDLPLLALTHRPDLNVLIGRWGFQPDPAELPAQYERLEAAALKHRAQYWLQDIRRRSLSDPQISRWLFDSFFPRLAQLLGGRLRVAYLANPTLHAHILSDTLYVPPSAYDGQPHAVAFFGDEGEALAWLLAAQARPEPQP